MPKRKKYPKLPNGYGSIKYLGKGRRNPYAVHPPTTEFNINGSPATPKALCYVNDWYIGFAVLTAYKAGTYFPGYEKTLSANQDSQTALSTLTQRLIADVNRITGAQKDESGKTFAEVYEDFFKWKFERDKSKKYSVSTLRSTRAAFNNCKSVHDKIFNELRHDDLQKVIDSCPLKHSSLELIVNLFKQMYAYAEIYELVDKNYAAHIKINIADDDEHGVPFSNEDLKKLWQIKDNPTAEFLLINYTSKAVLRLPQAETELFLFTPLSCRLSYTVSHHQDTSVYSQKSNSGQMFASCCHRLVSPPIIRRTTAATHSAVCVRILKSVKMTESGCSDIHSARILQIRFTDIVQRTTCVKKSKK